MCMFPTTVGTDAIQPANFGEWPCASFAPLSTWHHIWHPWEPYQALSITMISNHLSNHSIAELLHQGKLAAVWVEVSGSAFFFVQGFLACTNETILESFHFNCIQGPFNMVKLALFTSAHIAVIIIITSSSNGTHGISTSRTAKSTDTQLAITTSMPLAVVPVGNLGKILDACEVSISLDRNCIADGICLFIRKSSHRITGAPSDREGVVRSTGEGLEEEKRGKKVERETHGMDDSRRLEGFESCLVVAKIILWLQRVKRAMKTFFWCSGWRERKKRRMKAKVSVLALTRTVGKVVLSTGDCWKATLRFLVSIKWPRIMFYDSKLKIENDEDERIVKKEAKVSSLLTLYYSWHSWQLSWHWYS
jgi:hypothetical protein